jgi:5-methylcytosine-specific restriction endonuclease McrA
VTGEYLPQSLRTLVRRRAKELGAYCVLPQWSQDGAFHLNHVIPRDAGGPTDASNLALACVGCSLRKGPQTHATDPATKAIIRLYHPRRDPWAEHFRWSADWLVEGRTAIGRTTIEALKLNRTTLVKLRRFLATCGLFPPS